MSQETESGHVGAVSVATSGTKKAAVESQWSCEEGNELMKGGLMADERREGGSRL